MKTIILFASFIFAAEMYSWAQNQPDSVNLPLTADNTVQQIQTNKQQIVNSDFFNQSAASSPAASVAVSSAVNGQNRSEYSTTGVPVKSHKSKSHAGVRISKARSKAYRQRDPYRNKNRVHRCHHF